MANQEDGFLREVEEELRRERLEQIWRQYGTYIIAGAVLVVLCVLGYKLWDNHRIAAAQSLGATYEDALNLAEEKKTGSAAAEFEKVAAGSGGYAQLARLQLASALLKEGKKAEALAAYEELAKSSNADKFLRGFATLQVAALRLDEADFTEMQNRLNPLIGDDSAWRYSARNLLGLAAYRAGKNDEARTLLTPLLVDQKTPQSIANRAQIVMAEIAAAELEKKSGAAAPAKSGSAEPAAKAGSAEPVAKAGTAAAESTAGETPSATKKE
jgi:hypothetical protein